jgi:hypothetical protein
MTVFLAVNVYSSGFPTLSAGPVVHAQPIMPDGSLLMFYEP